MLIFSLEWQPRPAVMTWANQISALPQYADYTAVLLTHNYLQADNTRSTTTNVAGDASGETLWNNLIKTHSNFEMVFNGHFGGDGEGFLDSTDNAGKTVHQMFFNTQFETLGGDGWIRLVEFLNDGRTVRVRTYSPLLDLYRTTPEYDFQFQLSRISGDFNDDGIVGAADYVWWRKNSGLSASYATWRSQYGLLAGSGSESAGNTIPEPSAGLLFSIAAGSSKSTSLPLAA